MKLNVGLKEFKKTYDKKRNQVLYYKIKSKSSFEIENLINNFLEDTNSFIFESVEKGTIRGRYTIIGLNPDKIWDIRNNVVNLDNNGKINKIKTNPLKYLNKLINEFKIEILKSLLTEFSFSSAKRIASDISLLSRPCEFGDCSTQSLPG